MYNIAICINIYRVELVLKDTNFEVDVKHYFTAHYVVRPLVQGWHLHTPIYLCMTYNRSYWI